MADLSHREADLLAAEVETGRASDAQRMRLEVHLQRCADCAARHARIQGLTRALRDEPAPERRLSDPALALRAMMRARHAPPERRRRPLRGWVPAMAAAALLAGLAAGGIHLATRAGPSTPVAAPGTGSRDAPSRPPEPPASPEPQPEGDVLVAGELVRPCDGVAARAADETVARVERPASAVCRLHLERGTLRLQVDPEAGVRVDVRTPGATVEVVGTVFVVRAEGETTRVAVERGTVLFGSGGGKVRVRAGQEGRVDSATRGAGREVPEVHDAPPEVLDRLAGAFGLSGPAASTARDPEPAGSAAEPQRPAKAGRSVGELRRMVRQGRSAEARSEARERSRRSSSARRRGELLTIVAESYAVEGSYAEAVRVYRRVAEGSPPATAGNALMAAAGLLLDRLGEPEEALHLYGRYLNEHPDGALRETASLERCRALRGAGRAPEAQRCARRYLEQFPDGRLRRAAEGLIPE